MMNWEYMIIFLLGIMVMKIYAEPSAIIVFGDSTVDMGTNFHIPSTPFNFQANRHPYGFKAFNGVPTGRFTEGRNILDFIAEYAGFPVLESFAKPGADFSKGVNFASGGAGALVGTNKGMVVSLGKQLENFNKFCKLLSQDRSIVDYEVYLSNAIYFISIGGNDYLGGYFGTPQLQEAYTPQQFVSLVVSNITNAIEVLYSKGARKFVVLGLGPLGCIPPLRILNGTGGCHVSASTLGQAHNYALALAIQHLRNVRPDSIIVGAHFYDFFNEIQNNFAAYGFKEAFKACCGAGPYRGLGHCGIETEDPETSYELCDDPTAHIWWDPYHPSERVHQQYAQGLWTGNAGVVEPVSLQMLFSSTVGSSASFENPSSSFPQFS